MRSTLGPIFLTPRMLPRRWGRADLGAWFDNAPRPRFPIGEVWSAHPSNTADDGRHLGAHLVEAPEMLGDLGRAPPSLRLIFTDATAAPLASDAHVAFWRVLEAPSGAQCMTSEADGRKPRALRCRTGDAFRVSYQARLQFPRGVIALEARASFAPRNSAHRVPALLRLSPETKPARATLLRDGAMSVERWSLPKESEIHPDGETCHMLMALTQGVSLDGRALAQGEAAFIPANARPMRLHGAGARVLAAYPDMVPTAIWRIAPEPDPSGAALAHPTPATKVVPASAPGISPRDAAAA